jgi:hypothetical protein
MISFGFLRKKQGSTLKIKKNIHLFKVLLTETFFILVATKFSQNPPPPPLATVGTWPKILVKMVSFFRKKDKISILPYYIYGIWNIP